MDKASPSHSCSLTTGYRRARDRVAASARFRPSALIVIRAIVLVVLNFYACERVGPSVLAS